MALWENFGGQIFPDHASYEGFYAMVGMATLMSAVLQAPLAALMALLELTNNPNIILPGMFSIVIANMVVSQLFKQRSFWETQLGDRGLELTVSPIKQALRSIGVAGVMSRSIASINIESTPTIIEKALTNKPRWILIQEDEHVISLMSASDLVRHLMELEAEQEKKPEQENKEEELVNLMQIPANRQDIVSINLQATLEEAFDKMEQRKITAAYVYRITQDGQERIYGVLTRDMITDQYIYSKN